jgi:hypothetical protein
MDCPDNHGLRQPSSFSPAWSKHADHAPPFRNTRIAASQLASLGAQRKQALAAVQEVSMLLIVRHFVAVSARI